MSFAPFASLGLSLLSGWSARGITAAQNRVAAARAAAANKIREGRNEEAAAMGSLARFMQSENNKRRLAAAGEQYNAGQQTLARMQQAQSRASFEDRLANAERAGAYAANAAFSGTAGATVDLVDTTARLQAQRAAFYRDQRAGFANYDAMQQISGIMPTAIRGLDLTSVRTGMDYSVDIPDIRVEQGNALTDTLLWAGSNPTALGSILETGARFFQPTTAPSSGTGLRYGAGFETGLTPGAGSIGIRIR